MIFLLHQQKRKDVAEAISSHLLEAFRGYIKVTLGAADEQAFWPGKPSWDDLLLVIFDEGEFPKSGNVFIENYFRERKDASLLPVALSSAHTRPPMAAEKFKALVYDVTSSIV